MRMLMAGLFIAVALAVAACGTNAVQNAAVAPEVCEHNGSVQHVTIQDGMYKVVCSDHVVQFVQR